MARKTDSYSSGYHYARQHARDLGAEPEHFADGGDVNDARRVAKEIQDTKRRALDKPFKDMTPDDDKVAATTDLLAGKLNKKYGSKVYSDVQEAPAMTYYKPIPPDDDPDSHRRGGAIRKNPKKSKRG